MVRAANKIAEVLAEAGVEYVFGIPGGGTGMIYDALFDHQEEVRTVLARHEQGAAIMADMVGRLTGRPAVVMGQGVFIGSTAGFGIMEAFSSGSPMLVLTDTSDSGFWQHGANQSGAGEYGSIDLLSIFRSMTKYTTIASTPNEAVIGVQLAAKHAVSGRPGPACVLMRSSSILGDVSPDTPPRILPTQGYLNTSKPAATAEAVQHAVQALASAKRPVIISGNGVHTARAYAELKELAELFAIPVATSYKGKSTLEETHPLALGMVGIYGQKVANAVVGEADLVLVVGARLAPQDTVMENPKVIDPTRQRIIQIDIDPRNAGWVFPVELGLVGDARVALRQILDVAPQVAPKPPNPKERERRVAALAEKKRALDFFEDAALHIDSSPVLPQRLVRLLQESLDPATIITLDAGNNRAWMCHYYQSQRPGTFYAPGGIAGMGWSVPAAFAAKLVHPERPVVGVTGDGGFMMSSHVLSTAVQYDVPAIFVVMNDGGLGMVREHQGARRIASEFADMDHGKLAQAYGAFGVQVDNAQDLPKAIRDAQRSGKPAVIDVVIDREPHVDDFRADKSKEYSKGYAAT